MTIPRERRRHAVAFVRRTGVLYDDRLSDDAKLTYVVGALICDDVGRIKKDKLERAMRDPVTLGIARSIVIVAGPSGGL